MRRMRREAFAASTLSLGLKPEKGSSWWTEERRTPFRDDHTALAALAGLFARAKGADALRRTKKVSVTLHGLVDAERRQGDLLEDACARRARLRWERLTDLMDTLAERYQSPILRLGPRIEPPGRYAGAKIAFGRIPDLADF
jgi:DNA polymerase-4